MRNVSFEELMAAIDAATENPYLIGQDSAPEDMEYNGYTISFRNSCQFHHVAVTRPGNDGTVLIMYDNNYPAKIIACDSEYTPRAYFIAYVTGQIDKYYADKKARDGNVYGYVNGKPVYSHDEFATTVRKFGPIESDSELIEFAKKETCNWSYAGWNRTFTTFPLDSSDHLHSRLTNTEWARLVKLQNDAIAAAKAADEARQWHKVRTVYWADNSIEEIWEDKDGIQKTVMTDGPHGDACY